MEERRKYTRFKARDGVVVIFRPQPSQLCMIDDISLGGFKGSYILNNTVPPEDFSEMTIFTIGNPDRLEHLKFNTVDDLAASVEKSFMLLPVRQKRVAFKGLSVVQAASLNSFIQQNTIQASAPFAP